LPLWKRYLQGFVVFYSKRLRTFWRNLLSSALMMEAASSWHPRRLQPSLSPAPGIIIFFISQHFLFKWHIQIFRPNLTPFYQFLMYVLILQDHRITSGQGRAVCYGTQSSGQQLEKNFTIFPINKLTLKHQNKGEKCVWNRTRIYKNVVLNLQKILLKCRCKSEKHFKKCKIFGFRTIKGLFWISDSFRRRVPLYGVNKCRIEDSIKSE